MILFHLLRDELMGLLVGEFLAIGGDEFMFAHIIFLLGWHK